MRNVEEGNPLELALAPSQTLGEGWVWHASYYYIHVSISPYSELTLREYPDHCTPRYLVQSNILLRLGIFYLKPVSSFFLLPIFYYYQDSNINTDQVNLSIFSSCLKYFIASNRPTSRCFLQLIANVSSLFVPEEKDACSMHVLHWCEQSSLDGRNANLSSPAL